MSFDDTKSWENKMSNPPISDISVNATPKKYVSPILYLPDIFAARQKRRGVLQRPSTGLEPSNWVFSVSFLETHSIFLDNGGENLD